MRFIYYKL